MKILIPLIVLVKLLLVTRMRIPDILLVVYLTVVYLVVSLPRTCTAGEGDASWRGLGAWTARRASPLRCGAADATAGGASGARGRQLSR